MSSDYFPVHAHSQFSVLDGMGSVEDMAEVIAQLGQPALALTDHGTMAGTIRLYLECRKRGLAAFPGSEMYLVTDADDPVERERRYHLGLLALTEKGFRALIALSSRSHTRERYHRRPLIDMSDLADLSRHAKVHVALTTGCYFGLVIQKLVNEGPAAAERIVKLFAHWFPYTFVELQNHDIETTDHSDSQITKELLRLASSAGLPVVLGQDSHYCHSYEQPVHDLMKDICYFGDNDDNRFPGSPYHLASTKWLRRKWSKVIWQDIEAGHGYLLDLNKLKLSALDTYTFHVPTMSDQPDIKLAAEVATAVKYLGGASAAQNSRIRSELKVIKDMGMADYFLMVSHLIQWCQSQGIIVDARGSANGSVVCFLLGITTVDPHKWKTSFERFLSPQRQKPPDIDLDIEHARRHEVIEYLQQMFPTMSNIGTYHRIGIKEGEEGDHGSVFVQYAAAKRKKEGNYAGVADEDRPLLLALADTPVRRSLGAHAGGFVVPAPDLAIGDYLATALIPSSGTTVTQAVMEDVEDAGYVKLDILGLRQLTTLRMVMELIGKDPIADGSGWIPDDDPKALRVLRSGVVGNGVFQFEGYSTAKGAREMKVASTKEAIDCIALYRPAVMAGGQTARYLLARSSGTPEPLLGASGDGSLGRIVDDTWGVLVFQDQVIEVMRSVGLTFQDWNDFLKAVKASNTKITEYAVGTFTRVMPRFIAAAIANCAMTRQEAKNVWHEVIGFTDYGFNKAHATNYGLRGYRMAYLKAHYPTEFMAATLAVWAGTPKEPKYVHEAHRLRMVIHRADVNRSSATWTMEGPGHLRRGLVSVKGVGEATAHRIVTERDQHGHFTDEADYRRRARVAWGKLAAANALKSLGVVKETD
jgi:DNA polymerase-3 subunit alpha